MERLNIDGSHVTRSGLGVAITPATKRVTSLGRAREARVRSEGRFEPRPRPVTVAELVAQQYAGGVVVRARLGPSCTSGTMRSTAAMASRQLRCDT